MLRRDSANEAESSREQQRVAESSGSAQVWLVQASEARASPSACPKIHEHALVMRKPALQACWWRGKVFLYVSMRTHLLCQGCKDILRVLQGAGVNLQIASSPRKSWQETYKSYIQLHQDLCLDVS